MSSAVTQSYQVTVSGLRCNNCALGLTKKLNALDKVDAQVSFANEKATFECPESQLEDVIKAIRSAGYHLHYVQETYDIEGWRCGGCANKTKQKLEAIVGIGEVSVNSTLNQLTVERNPDLLTQSDIIELLKQQGYQAQLKQRHSLENHSNQFPWQLPLSILLTLPLLAPMMAMLWGQKIILPGWLEFALGSIVQFVIGAPFYRGAWQSLKNKSANMDTLVTLGTSAAYFYSCYLLFIHGREGQLYFESAAVIITFISIGKWLEERAKRSAGDAMASLLALQPQQANVVTDNGITTRESSAVNIGDVVRVMAGAKVPLDGVVTKGSSEFNEAFISGESLPVVKNTGDKVYAGAVNQGEVIEFSVTAKGADSNLGQIIAMVEQAQQTKAPIEALVDKVAAWFVPAVLLISAITFIIWLALGASFEIALINSVAVLVVACPCALGLATPAAIVVGSGRAAKQGIVIRDPKALQIAGDIKHIAFDKTGTLTQGKPSLKAENYFSDQRYDSELKALLEHSEHPLAQAILQAQWLTNVNTAQATDFKTIAGKGLVAEIDQQQFFLGNRQLLTEHGNTVNSLFAINASEVLFASSSQIIAQFELEDVVRGDSAQAINALNQMSIETTLLSGDNENTAQTVASQLNMKNWLGQQTPEQKLSYLQQIQNSGHKIAMVGDGINDAPALAQADLGIAMGGGTQVAITSAQITLMQDSPLLVAKAINIAKATWRTVKQNLFLAFAFNTVAIPAAAMGYLSPQLAGLAMALSSVTVLTNALRLKYSGKS